MARKDERLKYALSFKGKGMENEELKENIQLAILDGAVWADKTMIDKACEWITQHIEEERYKTPDEESYRHGQPYDYFETNMFIDDFRKAMED